MTSQRAAFVALCGTIVAWAACMCALEPVVLDGWFVVDFRGDWLEFARANRAGDLFWGNARLGQIATAFTYDRVVHVIVTPVVVLALFLGMVAHVRGRRPRVTDAWLLLVVVALTVLAQPQLGPVLFYRPYAGNYLFGLVLQLAWLLPYRVALERDTGGGPAALAGMLVLGAAAGACNEHTGPALVVAGAAIAVRFARRGGLRAWMIAGLVGFVAGYLALVLAPAQSTRYCGVAELSIVDRIVERGLLGNLAIAFALVTAGRYLWLAGATVVIALRVARTGRSASARGGVASDGGVPGTRATPESRGRARGVGRDAERPDARGGAIRAALRWLALGFAVSITLIASPKQGDRLLFAPLVFATIGIAGLVDLATGRARVAIAAVAGAVVAGAIAWSTAIYVRVTHDVADRIARFAAARGDVAHVPMLRDGDSRWFLGDDLRSDRHRAFVAERFGLADIELAGHPTIPFRYEVRYDLAGGEHRTRSFGPLAQLCEARRDFVAEAVALGARTAELDVAPRARILDGRPIAASRWRDGRLVAPTATVVNERGTRWIAIDRNGLAGPLDVILVGPGREEHLAPDGPRWPYQPWGPGSYWIVACAASECYLAEALHHTQVDSKATPP